MPIDSITTSMHAAIGVKSKSSSLLPCYYICYISIYFMDFATLPLARIAAVPYKFRWASSGAADNRSAYNYWIRC
jgi:hypothetical protein